jgi:hypothetical protein
MDFEPRRAIKQRRRPVRRPGLIGNDRKPNPHRATPSARGVSYRSSRPPVVQSPVL